MAKIAPASPLATACVSRTKPERFSVVPPLRPRSSSMISTGADDAEAAAGAGASVAGAGASDGGATMPPCSAFRMRVAASRSIPSSSIDERKSDSSSAAIHLRTSSVSSSLSNVESRDRRPSAAKNSSRLAIGARGVWPTEPTARQLLRRANAFTPLASAPRVHTL